MNSDERNSISISYGVDMMLSIMNTQIVTTDDFMGVKLHTIAVFLRRSS